MTRVYLYEDSSGSLFLHKHGDEIVYGHFDLMLDSGSRFRSDAEMVADGATADWLADRIPYEQLESAADGPQMKRVATWEDGRVTVYGTPSASAMEYIGVTDELSQTGIA